MNNIYSVVDDATSYAEFHASNCLVILEEQGLAEALEYCRNQNIDPPQCSLVAESKNADKMRAIATRMLGEEKWWKRRLRNQGVQQFEHDKIKSGNVTHYVSDEALEYQLSKKRR